MSWLFRLAGWNCGSGLHPAVGPDRKSAIQKRLHPVIGKLHVGAPDSRSAFGGFSRKGGPSFPLTATALATCVIQTPRTLPPRAWTSARIPAQRAGGVAMPGAGGHDEPGQGGAVTERLVQQALDGGLAGMRCVLAGFPVRVPEGRVAVVCQHLWPRGPRPLRTVRELSWASALL